MKSIQQSSVIEPPRGVVLTNNRNVPSAITDAFDSRWRVETVETDRWSGQPLAGDVDLVVRDRLGPIRSDGTGPAEHSDCDPDRRVVHLTALGAETPVSDLPSEAVVKQCPSRDNLQQVLSRISVRAEYFIAVDQYVEKTAGMSGQDAARNTSPDLVEGSEGLEALEHWVDDSLALIAAHDDFIGVFEELDRPRDVILQVDEAEFEQP